MSIKLKLSRDTNGNKTLKASFRGWKGFSIRTNGNLPVTHMMDFVLNEFVAMAELERYIKEFGTVYQKDFMFLGKNS